MQINAAHELVIDHDRKRRREEVRQILAAQVFLLRLAQLADRVAHELRQAFVALVPLQEQVEDVVRVLALHPFFDDLEIAAIVPEEHVDAEPAGDDLLQLTNDVNMFKLVPVNHMASKTNFSGIRAVVSVKF